MLHAILFTVVSVTVLTRNDKPRPSDAEPVLSLVLIPQVQSESVEPVAVEPEALDKSSPSEVAEKPVSPVVSTALRLESVVAPDSKDVILTPPSKLNLSRPGDWGSLATQSPEELANSAFKKSTREAIAQRKQERAQSRALSRSQVERLGLPEEEYRRRTDVGEEVKTAKGCFVKRAEQGLNGHSERWWRTACRDSSKPDWQREVLSFGSDHRVRLDSDQTPPEP